jgi:hypothetical protein
MLLLHLLLPWLLLLLLLLLLGCGVLASHHADLLCMLQVVPVAFEDAAVNGHLHPHNLIHKPEQTQLGQKQKQQQQQQQRKSGGG